MKNKKTDLLYATPKEAITDFIFDEKVAEVFPDMINRSVPGYSTIVSLSGIMASRYAKASSNCYDLGCSLGAVSLSMAQQVKQPNCKIIAVDNSPAMVDRCRENIFGNNDFNTSIDVVCSDISDIKIERASVVALNFTLQFIDPACRLEILKKIFNGLMPGGVLILSEKISFADDDRQEFVTEMHHTFKKVTGYSDLEISQKRTALENVLRPDTMECHRQRIKDAGFSTCELWFQCLNFVSMIAKK